MVDTLYKKSRTLFLMDFLSLFRSIRENLARNITLAFCAGIIVSLCLYLLNDFSQSQLIVVSEKMAEIFSQGVALVLLLVGSFFLRVKIQGFFYSPSSLWLLSNRLGEENKTLLLYKRMALPFFYLWTYLPFWGIAIYFFGHFSFLTSTLLLLFPLPFLSLLPLRENRLNLEQRKEMRPGKKLIQKTPSEILIFWRVRQIFEGSWLSKLLLLSSIGLAVLAAILGFWRPSPLPSFFFSFLSSFVAGATLIKQIGRDFESVWIERSTGVSHEQYLKSIFQLSNLIALCLSFFISTTFLLCSFSSLFQIEPNFLNTLKLILTAYTPCACVPLIALQIDPRKVLLHTLILGIVSLFLSSLLLIHPGFFLLFPFFISYGKESQANRFYSI